MTGLDDLAAATIRTKAVLDGYGYLEVDPEGLVSPDLHNMRRPRLTPEQAVARAAEVLTDAALEIVRLRRELADARRAVE